MHDGFKTFVLSQHGRDKCQQIAMTFDTTLESLKAIGVSGRHLALVTTKLEEACSFAKKSIAADPTYHP